MTQELWTNVDRYLTEKLIPSDPALDAALRANAAAGLPNIDVAPNQGKLLNLIARLAGAKRILEIGTLGGYSTIWLARALPADGHLVTLEVSPKHAEVATANLKAAGLAAKVELRLGPGVESLAKLHAEKVPPFDLIFIDADKVNNVPYLDGSLRLSRPGTLIICDNVIRDGAILDANTTDPVVTGTRQLFDRLSIERRVDATALQTVGSKGHDGFCFMIVNRPA